MSIESIADLRKSQREYWDRGRPARNELPPHSTLRDEARGDSGETERAGRPRSQYTESQYTRRA